MARTAARQQPFSDLSEESLRCRINSHRWKPYNAKKVVGAFETDEICETCTAHRLSVLSNRGAVIKRSIAYPEHYLRKGEGPLERSERDAMRLTVLYWDFGVR